MFLRLPEGLRVLNIYLYPNLVGITVETTDRLEIGTPGVFHIRNLHGDPEYNRDIPTSLMDGDGAFWMEYPQDIPERVSISLKLTNQEP
jgi:hypothetical protein